MDGWGFACSGDEMADDRTRTDGLIDDPALAVLLTQRRAWMCRTGDRRAVIIVPSSGDSDYWHYALVDLAENETEGSIRPVSRHALALFIEPYGVGGGDDWRPCDSVQPGDPNPMLNQKVAREGR